MLGVALPLKHELHVRVQPIDGVSKSRVVVGHAAPLRDALGVGMVELAIHEGGDDLHEAHRPIEALARVATEGAVDLQLRAPMEDEAPPAAGAPEPHHDRTPVAGRGRAGESEPALAAPGLALAHPRQLHGHQLHDLPPLNEVDIMADVAQRHDLGILLVLTPLDLPRQRLLVLRLLRQRRLVRCRVARRRQIPPAVSRLRRRSRLHPLAALLQLVDHG